MLTWCLPAGMGSVASVMNEVDPEHVEDEPGPPPFMQRAHPPKVPLWAMITPSLGASRISTSAVTEKDLMLIPMTQFSESGVSEEINPKFGRSGMARSERETSAMTAPPSCPRARS